MSAHWGRIQRSNLNTLLMQALIFLGTYFIIKADSLSQTQIFESCFNVECSNRNLVNFFYFIVWTRRDCQATEDELFGDI